ncbi:MAG: PHP domain-containing protein [Acidimicrobiia bacterium]
MPQRPSQLHPHLDGTRVPGTVRVDCHLHTCYSGDAVTTLDEFADRVVAAGVEVVCVTDHHAVRGAQELAGSDPGFRVIVGEEIRTTAGELIGLFLGERVPFGLTPEETVARVRAQGGIVYVPHPFDVTRRAMHEPALRSLCATGGVDAVEVFNAKASLDHLNERAAALAGEFDLPGGAGSDAHDPAGIGAAFVEMQDFDGPQSFLAALRGARVVGHRFDRPRTWTPRVIPSGLDPTG